MTAWWKSGWTVKQPSPPPFEARNIAKARTRMSRILRMSRSVVRLVTADHVLREGEEYTSPEPRIKRLSFIKRKPDWDRDEFFRYWKDVHGPLALALPGVQRYVQCHALPSAYERGEPQYDGVAELWFETLGDLHFALASAAYKDHAQPDGAKFLDSTSTFTLITEEHRIV